MIIHEITNLTLYTCGVVFITEVRMAAFRVPTDIPEVNLGVDSAVDVEELLGEVSDIPEEVHSREIRHLGDVHSFQEEFDELPGLQRRRRPN